MDAAIDEHPAQMSARAARRTGAQCYPRHLLTELGDIELHIPRTRRYSAPAVVHAYAKRAPYIDCMILACFLLRLATRKVAAALLPVLGRKVSAGTPARWPRA
jgi:transposase-like protein